jgi:hypothetical protein
MKKLLLVMLVPVLVLGVMGCGKVPNGDSNPISLQGAWTTGGSDNVDLVISGNQVTLLSKQTAGGLGNIALRTSYAGPHGTNEDGILTSGEFTLTFSWYDKPYDEIGSITCTIADADNFTVKSVVYKAYYQNVMLPSAGAAYTKS